MSQFTLRIASPAEAETLSAISSKTFFETFEDVYSAEDMQTFLSTACSVDKLRQEMEDPRMYTVFVYTKDDQVNPCGYGMVHDCTVRTGDDGVPEDYVQLKRLYLLKAVHGKGAARIVMDHMMEYMHAKQRKVIWLGVWEHNLRAQKFYEKYNFEETGEHVFMVGATKDRDLLFTLKQ
ncbi:hypothetical protein Poli38472_005184 [Pythium oligandrum]|uniref:N-acetyltransferase domain-containing protein n=1 Tax=Pythium oligandrum TaxID=41045 RepID=A0A8K1FHC4_PYTOL|nr:hypothetical protein Poli38472_005184 [Pythium oligandrum]|eukprot:TMW62566.1 hypothetical protein Poli38472_005184 [Pythium oligandrum]